MSTRDARIMGAPSIEAECCPFCGDAWAERHHIVPRSRGGAKGPTVTVCGFGNASGCHGLLHAHRLHLDWRGGRWEFLLTEAPCSDDEAGRMEGWAPVPDTEGATEEF